MAIFAISDLHLPMGVKKPMDIFGKRWENYVYRIKENWEREITKEDYVIIPGDISWATYLEEAKADFDFINKLPGTKIISKGNHDYWWTTMSKLNKFKEEQGYDTIHFIHNNSFAIGNIGVCASRGWITPSDKDFKGEDDKIYKRELIRMELSIEDAKKKGATELIAAIHYPPYEGFLEIAKRHSVKCVLYGHLHSENMDSYNEISPFTALVSCDYLSFLPKKIIL